jgi:hypothetical protein
MPTDPERRPGPPKRVPADPETYPGRGKRRPIKQCPNRTRHWFTVYGMVGMRRPDCSSCGEPNPKFTEQDRIEWEAYMEDPVFRARVGHMDNPVFRERVGVHDRRGRQ